MTRPIVDASTRFDVLDALRGVCALIVALYHFNTTGLLSQLGIVRHGWIFVDYFFVLSGFVIAHSYGARLSQRMVGIPRFIALRFGRIYPLHIVALLAFVAFEMVLVIFGDTLSRYVSRPPFTGSREVGSLLQSVFILQSFGIPGNTGWNFPAWSIAAELWTYALFAFIFLVGERMLLMISGALAIICTAIMMSYAPDLNHVTFNGGVLRCISGFGIGVITYHAFCRHGGVGGHAWETGALLVTVGYVWLAKGASTFIAPLLFGAMIFILASQRGVVSKVLSAPLFQRLGLVSYSIYMIHIFVQQRLGDALQLTGIASIKPNAEGRSVLDASPLMADLITLAMLAMVVTGAFITYYLVEKPGRDLTRKWLGRTPTPASEPVGAET